MIPSALSGGTETSSERRVFEALASSRLRGVALHSLNLPTHQYKLTSELDFVLILDDIVLVVEVKGAQVSCSGGVWTYSDRSGHFRQDREGPFKQVISGMYALRDRLGQRLGAAAKDIAYGFLVVTPDVDLAISSFEWDAETYCGRGQFNRDFIGSIRRILAYWRGRQIGKLPIDDALLGALLKDLRPDFDRSPLLDARADALDVAFIHLTDEQFSRLDLVSEAPRVICSGGAGTGKTLVAAEMARRQALAGHSVLFTCRSRILAAFIRRLLAATNVTVCAVNEIPDGSSFDLVVVDEAQDLMNFGTLGRLEAAVRGGWGDGRWVMFMDQNRQAHLYGDFDADALQFVQSFGPVPATLRTNCRNTREIAFQTRALTGADTGVAAAGAGPKVEFATASDAASETAALSTHLRSLREQDVPDGHVTIVSMRGDWATSAAQGLSEAWKRRLRLLDEAVAADWPGSNLTWASAVEIKGLENRFVCVIDIDSLETEKEIDLLYVALSRPRAGLWLATNPAIHDRLIELYQANAVNALEALKKAGS
ncbi:nuclease-related domain-containing DEAD/DEAH box helicase [[Mycobacterium] nativiensis]|uniref:NERD domain-containing protein n=1 Tax=[Mycobacterium] nativiensis TaxID=2855503 RepID=A0ABU5XX89_9MYCO|nr:NERD domain-containing protein [Mycolicibacter sp. MYC340]MEB3032091.1 NERD domain-containing protein [Mycolicibacter sp. MYC340]